MAALRKRVMIGDQGGNGKRLKLTDQVNAKLAIVADAVASARFRSDACQMMLESMVPGCLGSGLDERDDLQNRAVDIIREVVESLKSDVDFDLKRKDDYVHDPQGTDMEMKKEAQLAGEGAAHAEDDMQEKERALEAAEDGLDSALDTLREAKKALADAEKNHKVKVQLATDFDDAYTKHFVPLRDGMFKTKAEADGHVQSLKRFFMKFDYEDSLMSAFAPASRLQPVDRKHFDTVTMTEAEKGFLNYKDEVHKEAEDSFSSIDAAKRAVEAAEAAVEAAKHSVREAGLVFGRAVTTAWKANLEAAAARKALQDAPKSPSEAEKQSDQSKRMHARFMDGPYEAFAWLKERVAILETRKAKRR
eukprot:TRINITY_DN1527_c0_g1_i3.p1 TRINITY_DN1527_c0_g1~~TRINITY_DN1527_c0_g1_i3.p1  ORF type:complete len:362 (-),score=95.68 TRINITY_DN1527_c0_g1_i3:62-1147(-)